MTTVPPARDVRLTDPKIASLNVASPDCAEPFFRGRLARCRNLRRASSLAELREILDHRLTEVAVPPARLDLIGHSTRGHHLLRLGATPVDMLDRQVARFFRALAEDQILPRQQILAVRLLGCETAVTDGGRRTLRMLAHTLDLPVYGTTTRLLKSHSDADGFNPAFSHILVEASALTSAGTSDSVP